MLVQTLYLLADLYWVGRLGKEAIAAVGVAGNLMMVVVALTQMLGVGTTAVIAQAAGRKEQPEAERTFNQSLVMSLCIAAAFGIGGFLVRDSYCHALTADRVTADLAKSYLNWFIPALLLQFPLVTLGSALRATGIVKPAVGLQVLSVLLNIVLAPLLIFGIGPWPRLGVGGAALATFISILVADVLMLIYFEKKYDYLRVRLAQCRPQMQVWWAMLKIGLPAGAEFALFSINVFVVYAIIRQFGAAAQAGFGIGMRIIQAGFMPVVALAFSVAPVAGQNFGARLGQRVKDTFKDAAWMAGALMVAFALACHLLPGPLVRVFSKDEGVIAVGTEYLRIISFNYVASGLVFVASSTFQAMGNTVPSLIASVVRIALVAIPGVIISRLPGFELHWLWWLSVASVFVQLVLAMLLLRREFSLRLAWSSP
jgi:putative MATE family efflux protein